MARIAAGIIAAFLAAIIFILFIGWAFGVVAFARNLNGEYDNEPPEIRAWYESAQLTPAAQERLGFKSCCAHSDVVRTRFRVSKVDGADQWEWLNGTKWEVVPSDIIHVSEHAPDGQPTLFAAGAIPTCFYPGSDGN